MQSTRSSTYEALKALQKIFSIENEDKQTDQNSLLISASTKLEEAVSIVRKMQRLQSVQLAKDILEEVGAAVAQRLPGDCKLILDPETPEKIVITIAKNMQPMAVFALPATMPQNIAVEAVKALKVVSKVSLHPDMPQDTAIAIIKALPHCGAIVIDTKMPLDFVKTVVSNLPKTRAVTLSPFLSKDIVAAVHQNMPPGCWANELMIHTDNGERISASDILSLVNTQRESDPIAEQDSTSSMHFRS